MVASRRDALTYLAGDLTEARLAELRTLAPNVRVISGLTRETALWHAADAHGVDARLVTPELLERAPRLVWVQATSAGVDWLMGMDGLVKRPAITLTNFRAVHGPAIADHVFAMLLTLTRDLRHYWELQKKGEWSRGSEGSRPIALQDKTLLVVGIGGIGAEVAQRGHGFGMRVLATRRGDGGAPAYVERVGKPADLLAMLPEADVVVICVPLTAETERMFDARAFGAMKPGAYLVNIARGRIVDTAALLAALESGRLAGACLDVTDPEPLPAGHPLWKRADVVITPHVASDAELTDQRGWAVYKENFRRFGAGEPLLNVVDTSVGY